MNTDSQMLACIADGMRHAISRTREDLHNISNSQKSRLFVSNVSQRIFEKIFQSNGYLNVVKYDKSEGEPGEWLVDACITDDSPRKMAKDILFGMESESSSLTANFNEDFSKLVHLKCGMKLYLHGLGHGTPEGMKKRIKERRKTAAKVLEETDSRACFYIGFYPSPTKSETKTSIWDYLVTNYEHLNYIRLYRYNLESRKFNPVCQNEDWPRCDLKH